MRQKKKKKKLGVAVVLLANVFFWGWEMSEFGGGKCPNFGGGKCPPGKWLTIWLNKSDQLTHDVGCKTSVASNMPVTDKSTKSRKKCMLLDITTVFFHILVKDCDLLCNMLGKSFFIDKVLPQFSNLRECTVAKIMAKIQEKVFQIYTNAKTFILNCGHNIGQKGSCWMSSSTDLVFMKSLTKRVNMKSRWKLGLLPDSQASPKFLHRANLRNINSIRGQGLRDHFQLSGQDGSAPSTPSAPSAL